jgi:hypothetical protein
MKKTGLQNKKMLKMRFLLMIHSQIYCNDFRLGIRVHQDQRSMDALRALSTSQFISHSPHTLDLIFFANFLNDCSATRSRNMRNWFQPSAHK